MPQKLTEEILSREIGGYEIVVYEKHSSHWFEFKVYRIIGRSEDGTRIYNKDGYRSSPDPVEDRDLAQVAVSGSIKWDGCSNITIDDEPLHFCGRGDAQEFNALLMGIYDLAAELIPSYEGGLEESRPEGNHQEGPSWIVSDAR